MTYYVAGSIVVSSVISARASAKAAKKISSAANAATQLQAIQYDQSRQDLAPYREVAVGTPIYQNQTDIDRWDKNAEELRQQFADGFEGSEGSDIDTVIAQNLGSRPEPGEVTGYNGGSLNTLSDYGRSKVDQGEYIPASEVPQYERSVIDINPNIEGEVPQYDPNFDITKDPSYQFRKSEMERGVNRNSAGFGKLLSGNRLEEIIARTGDMASQEYGAAYGRNVNDYSIQRANEGIKYGRDVGDYGRIYNQNVDQYGRDLTAFNVDTSIENKLYGRGVGAYGRALDEERNYLNRLSSLSNIGQTATNQTSALGANYANVAGENIQAAGRAEAAGTLGQANAINNAVGGLTSLYGINQNSINQNQLPPPPQGNPYSYSPPVNNNLNYGGYA